MRDTYEPTHDINERPCLILELPVLSNKAASQLSDLLQSLVEHFDACYHAQILRAHRAREIEYKKRYREQCLFLAQLPLPFEDTAF
jgi:hypothetical protein